METSAAPADHTGRLKALRARMSESGTDLVAIGPGSHMQWLVGLRPVADDRPCLLLVTQHGETLLMPALNAEGARAILATGLHVWADDEGPDRALAGALVEIGAAAPTTVSLDETMRTDFALLLLDALPGGVRTSLAVDTVGRLRTVKDEGEIAGLRSSAVIADRALLAAFDAIRPGVSEDEIAGAIRTQFHRDAATPAFWTVASGPNGSLPHHATSGRHLETGDAVVLDVGAFGNGFPSDITRMAYLGTPTAEHLRVHAVVERAVQAALAAARPGVAANEVDAAARGVIANAGYAEFFVHRTGHGLGIDIHEHPYITASNRTPLQRGNVFSIEPGIYLPGRFGVRLEEIVVLREHGPEIFSTLSRAPRIIPA